MKNLKAIFEEAISRQEVLVLSTAHRFDDESQDDFYAKMSNRIKHITATLQAKDLHGINAICAGLDAKWQGFYIQRRRVDQLDNIYVSRLH